jgi:hypothetical protein
LGHVSAPVLLATVVRSGAYHPGSVSPAVDQKIHHALRIHAAGIKPESNVRQAIEATFDDLRKLVDWPALGCGPDPAGERRGLGVI